MIGILVYALATWRLTHMLTRESGPFEMFVALRDLAARNPQTNTLATCPSCASVWIAAVLLVCPWWLRVLLAGSGAAKLIEDYFYGEQAPAAGSVSPFSASWPIGAGG